MSLRWRIMGSTVFVIVLTVLISVGVGYYVDAVPPGCVRGRDK